MTKARDIPTSLFAATISWNKFMQTLNIKVLGSNTEFDFHRLSNCNTLSGAVLCTAIHDRRIIHIEPSRIISSYFWAVVQRKERDEGVSLWYVSKKDLDQWKTVPGAIITPRIEPWGGLAIVPNITSDIPYRVHPALAVGLVESGVSPPNWVIDTKTILLECKSS